VVGTKLASAVVTVVEAEAGVKVAGMEVVAVAVALVTWARKRFL